MTDQRTQQLVIECGRQEENCLYTSTIFYIWLRRSRALRRVFIVAPIILGALATWSVLDQPDMPWLQWLTAIFALLAGLLPAIYEALKLDVHIDEIARDAARFKILQDHFRQAARITALGRFEDFEAEFRALMDKMDEARATSLTPPERYFAAADKKIKAGNYDFSVDAHPPQPRAGDQ